MVVVTDLNSRLTTTDKAVADPDKQVAKFMTGPTRTAQDFQRPDPFIGKFKTNPRNDSFYQMFEDPAVSQADIDDRVGFYGNTFEGENNVRAQEFLSKYYSNLGGDNTAEGKGLIEPDRMVRPENLSQLSSQPATGGGGVQDPNVAGKFPSNSVAV